MIDPRPYQIEALDLAFRSWRGGVSRQLLSIPTGCGKTVIFALLAKDLNVRTLVLAHTEELILQAVAKFEEIWPGIDIGVVKAESDKVEAQVVVASVQTAARSKRLQSLIEQNFQLLIIDEAHHAASPSYFRLVNELGFLSDNQKLLIGVTATPRRGDGVTLKHIFQEITFERSLKTMMRAGYLAPLVGKQIFTKVELQQIGMHNGDFAASELAKVVNTPERNQLIVSHYQRYASDRKKTLVFCANVQHAIDLADAFNQQSIPSAAVYGSMLKEEREETLSSFSKGEYAVLTNCQLLTEGFDEPGIDCIVMGRPTRSSALFTQMIGRGTRTFPSKENCLVLDFTDNTSKNDLCTYKNTLDGAVATLFAPGSKKTACEPMEPAKTKTVDLRASNAVRILEDRVEKIEFFDATTFAWSPIGNDWHLAISARHDVWVRQSSNGFSVIAQNERGTIHLAGSQSSLEYALGVAEDWACKQTSGRDWAKKDAKWRSEPATPKQIEMLTSFGFILDAPLSKGQASQILDSRFKESATCKQIGWLKMHGFFPEHSLTKSEAGKMISQIKGAERCHKRA